MLLWVLSPGMTSERPPENPYLKHICPQPLESSATLGKGEMGRLRAPGVCGREPGAQGGKLEFCRRTWPWPLVRGPKLLGEPGTELGRLGRWTSK